MGENEFASVCVGLFGTCGSSTWRQEFIPALEEANIAYYNPQVAEWTPECATAEALHLVTDRILLFPVTDETTAFGSLAETGFAILTAVQSVAKSPERAVVVYIAPEVSAACAAEVGPVAAKDSFRARKLVMAHLSRAAQPNVYVCTSLEEAYRKTIALARIAQEEDTARAVLERLSGERAELHRWF